MPLAVQASLLISESFDYQVGVINGQGGSENGFSGNWAATNTVDSQWNIVTAGLTMNGVLSSGGSSSFTQTPAARGVLYATRSLSSALPSSSIIYGSFLFSLPQKALDNNAQLGVILGSSIADDNTAAYFYSPDGFGTQNPLVKAKGTSVVGGLSVTQGKTYLYLFQANASTGNTQVWVLNSNQYGYFGNNLDAATLNNAPTNTESDTGVVFRANVTAASGAVGVMDTIRILGYSHTGTGPGANGYDARVDEFRVSDLSLTEAATGAPSTVVAPTSIAITNPSFEMDTIAGQNAPTYQDQVPFGWTVPGIGSQGVLAPDAVEPNNYYNGVTSGYDGSKIGYIFSNSSLKQTLTEVIEPNTTYTLSAAIGNRSTNGAYPWAGYHLTLCASTGELVGDWTGVGRNLAMPGTFAKTTRSFTTGPNPPGLGKPLMIKLEAADPSNGKYVDFDHITLTKVPAVVRPAATPLDVYIVAGQSNSHGWKANVAELTGGNSRYVSNPSQRAFFAYKENNNGDAFYNTGSLGIVSPTGAGHQANFNGFGPELSAATDLAGKLTNRVAIVKFSVGGASLEGLFKKTANKLYPVMISHIQASLQQMADQGYAPSLKGMFWLQGENDSNASFAPLYAANISQFVQDVRQDLGVPNLKFIGTEINANMPSFSNTKPYVAQVNAGLQNLAANDSNARFVTTADIDKGFADSIHYTADQTIMIGQRWAAMAASIPLSYSEWQSSSFSPQEILSGAANDSADPDGDGISNLMEYAIGGNPKLADASSVFSMIQEAGTVGIQFNRDSRKKDLRYVIEGSEQLNQWDVLSESISGAAFGMAPSGSSLSETGTGISKVQFRVNESPTAGSRYFLRLKVVR